MPKNTSGIKVTCPNPKCGYSWYYTGDNAVTSCPVCGYRTRTRTARRIATPAGDALISDRKMDRLI